jgi:hypothetical protein
MTLAEFLDGLERYGCNINHWPQPMRGPAEGLLAHAGAALQAHSAMARVEDSLIASQPTPLPDIGNLIDEAARHRQRSLVRDLAPRLGWAAAAVLAFCLGLGFGATASHDDIASNIIEMAFSPFESIDVD